MPSFYSPKSDSELDIFRIIFPILGAVFGGLHCLGWNFIFPTRAEQTIWRLGSITITVIPLLYYLTALFSRFTSGNGGTATWTQLRVVKKLLQVVAATFASISIAFSPVYLIVRLILFIEAIVLLRKQPSSVFLVVDWTKFVPPSQVLITEVCTVVYLYGCNKCVVSTVNKPNREEVGQMQKRDYFHFLLSRGSRKKES